MPNTSRQKRPEWVPAEGGSEYTTNVVQGVASVHDGMPQQPHHSIPTHARRSRRRTLTVDEYVTGVRRCDRTVFAQAITLVESNAESHIALAQQVLHQLLPHTGNAIRIGITGVPGVGKSTFIEAFGTYLCQQGHQVAVLAVDPSSSLTRGSILGDKTRMEQLARNPKAFIRPSPSGGTLGGVARKSRETMLVCEAAGFDVLLVETVGVGQSETTVRSMVDFFLLLMLTGAGDELQGIKKGIMELADAIIIHKADGDNTIRAQHTQREYANAVHYLAPATPGWETQVQACSSLTGMGIEEIWHTIQTFWQHTTDSGVLAHRRRTQARDWMYAMIEEHLRAQFFRHPAVQRELSSIEHAVVEGTMPATAAVAALLDVYAHA